MRFVYVKTFCDIVGFGFISETYGFETGDFSAWNLSGNSTQFGVASDETELFNAGVVFGQTFQNVRSGNFAVHLEK